MEWLTQLLPKWLSEWLRIYVAPYLKLQLRVMARALLTGATDTLLFITLPVVVSISSQSVWNARYQLTTTQQAQVERWASIAQVIAYKEDIPPAVPLVLWFKENGLRDDNPNNCEGIMGLHTAVTSGALPCFPPGPQSAWDITRQLQLGAATFKSFCPDITYTTTNAEVIKRCYLYYNAGPRSRANPNNSAYVMNGYDAAHRNMILTDTQGRRHRLSALGAWPAHIAVQMQLLQGERSKIPLAIRAPAMLLQELVDKVWVKTGNAIPESQSDVVLPAPTTTVAMCREAVVQACFIEPHTDGDPDLRPHVNPLLIAPVERSELACGLLPGIDLIPPKASVVLAPMSGELIRYADGKGNLTIQIENEEWTVWIAGLRSYTAPAGEIKAGKPIGAISGAGSKTPGVHFAVYDKINLGFVDALSFIPLNTCLVEN